MSLPVIDREETLAAVGATTQKLLRLIRTAPDPTANAIGHWSVAELACHLSHVYSVIPKMLRDEGSPVKDHRQIAATWDAEVAADPERDLNVLADRIESGWKESEGLLKSRGWTDTTTWHGGLDAPVYTLAAVMISEAFIHGLDIARATGGNFDRNSSHARHVIYGYMPNLPDFLNKDAAQGLDATFELRVRGGPWVYLTVSGGALTISQVTDRRVDCRLSIDPATYLLVGFRRESQWAGIAKGQIVAWGRKPWLSLKFGHLIESP